MLKYDKQSKSYSCAKFITISKDFKAKRPVNHNLKGDVFTIIQKALFADDLQSIEIGTLNMIQYAVYC